MASSTFGSFEKPEFSAAQSARASSEPAKARDKTYVMSCQSAARSSSGQLPSGSSASHCRRKHLAKPEAPASSLGIFAVFGRSGGGDAAPQVLRLRLLWGAVRARAWDSDYSAASANVAFKAGRSSCTANSIRAKTEPKKSPPQCALRRQQPQFAFP